MLCITALTTSSKCKKDVNPAPDNPYGLPNATQNGANIFAYLNNGKARIVPNSIYTLGGGVNNDTLWISGSAGDSNYFERITINIKGNLQQASLYPIDNSIPGFRTIRINTNKDCFGVGDVQIIYSPLGSVLLTKLDKTNKIIAGTFYFEVYNAVQNKTLSITDGKFRLLYQPF